MYRLIRPILFLFSPETAHKLTLDALKILSYIPFSGWLVRLFCVKKDPSLEREVMGLHFPNPVGLAAGMDKNGRVYNTMSDMGFGFVEIGTITPLPQDGNPRPRCFRLVKDKAIINRMGINNVGVKQVVKNIRANHPRVLIGASIAKNSTTPNDTAYKDYEKAFAQLYDYVDYIALNISCPNVKDLATLQSSNFLGGIIKRLTEIRRYSEIYKPILLKVSPDLSEAQLAHDIEQVLLLGIDGVIACNTTTSREGLTTSDELVKSIGNGGLSGAPLKEKSLATIRFIHEKTNGNLPIIGVGGIMTPQDAQDMLDAGASLVQIYTGFIYEGPFFVRKILSHLKK